MEEDRKEEVEKKEKPKKSIPKRIFKALLYIILFVVGLNGLIYGLLSIPAIQQKACDFAIGELKAKLDTEIQIDQLRLSLFTHVSVEGIYIEDQAKDTLLYAKDLNVSLDPWELLKTSKLQITGISLNDFVVKVNQKDSVSDFNFQFIIDAFTSNDTTPQDTTKSSLAIAIEDIKIQKGRLHYDVLSAPKTSPHFFDASHIHLSDLTADVDLYSIDPDNFDIALNNLSAKEQSGVEIKALKGHLYSEGSQLWVDNLSLALPNSHLITEKVRYNLETDEFEITTNNTEINPKDVQSFLVGLKNLTENLSLKTTIKGKLPLIDIESINLSYGNECILEGKASISSYADYANADINLSIDRFKITPNALTSFVRLGDSTFTAPDMVKTMGDIFLQGKVNGKLSKFKLDTEVWCRQGMVNVFATGRADSTFNSFDVNSKLEVNNLNLRNILQQDSTGLGKLTAHFMLNAKQTNDKDLDAQVKGAVDALGIGKATLKSIPIEAYYNMAKMGIKTNAKMSIGSVFLDANMTQAAVPDIDFDIDIESLQIDPFYKNKDWKDPKLTLCLNGKIKGTNIDNLNGKVRIDSLDFKDKNFNFNPGSFVLEIGPQGDENRFITFASSLLTATLRGQYQFMTIADEMTNLMHSYNANVFQETRQVKEPKNDFTFDIKINNTEELGKILSLPVDIVQSATINGRINMIDRKINIDGNIPYIRSGSLDIKNTKLNIANLDSAFNILASTNMMMEQGFYNIAFSANGANSSIRAFVDVESNKTEVDIKGRIETLAQFNRDDKNQLINLFQVIPSIITVGDLKLNLLPAKILQRENRVEINNFGIGINRKRYFGADGVISSNKSDSLRVYFDHAQIGDVLEAFEVKNIHASVNGNIMLTNLLNEPEFYTKDFKMSDIIVFSDTLGTLAMTSAWNKELGGIKLDVDLDKGDENMACIKGMVYTAKDALDLKVDINKLPLGWMQPFVADMLNKVSGSISSDLTVKGSMSAPQVKGFFGFNNTSIGVDYTNVVYTISDTISISPDKVGFNNLVLKDSKGNSARLNASMTHNNFKNMKYSLDMNLDKLMVLDTKNRTDSLFYGRVFASGSVKIEGNDKKININMQVRNDKNSSINIQLPSTSEASDYKSVVYINVPEDKLKKELEEMVTSVKSEPLPINLNIKLNITPDLALGVIIDPVNNTSMQVKGAGNVNFTYNMATENMTTYGDYTLSEGSVRVSLQKISKLDFKIRQGSKLTFIGDPMKTSFDINAYRRVRANLKTLDVSLENESIGRIPVDCDLGITGNMNKMDLSYDISLPEATDDIQRRVNSLINTNEEKTVQFAYLIIAGSFWKTSGGSNVGDGMWTSIAAGAIGDGLNALFGSILGDKWEVGTNIDSSDGSLSDVDMSVNISRKFFDDKLKLKTNLGYRTENANNDNTVVGDFDAEYQLNSLWTLRAFNRTNDKFYKQAATTQGVGIMYTKDATTLKRLFQSFRRRGRNRNRPQQEQRPQPQEPKKEQTTEAQQKEPVHPKKPDVQQ